MVIALDAMGGDFAPQVAIDGALLAKQVLPKDSQIVLIGRQDEIENCLKSLGQPIDLFTIVHANDVIEMGEHPTKAIPAKPDSSIMKGFGMLMKGKADAFCSAGNTGAMMVGAMFTIKPIPGVIRPGIAAYIPQDSGIYNLIFDVGANAECKPEVLAQFAEMGSLFSQYFFNVENPRVGLMSLGTEEGKGTTITQTAHSLIKQNPRVNFIGNMEGRGVFNDTVDVTICDGFVGNVILKSGESMYPLLKKRGFVDEFVELYNWENVGGTPIIGVNGNVIIGHGASTALAIKNMIIQSERLAKSEIYLKIKSAFSTYVKSES